MEQEKIEKNLPEVQETELKEEKTRKIFIIFIVLLLFGGMCYYYAGINKHFNLQSRHSKLVSESIQQGSKSVINKPQILKSQTVPTLNQVQGNKAVRHDNPQVENNNITAQKPEESHKTATTEEIIPKTKFKPTDKSTFLSLKEKSSGKHDPFSYSESGFIPFTADYGQNTASYPGNLPPVPGTGNTGTLPPLPTLSGLPSAGLAPPPAPKPEDLIIVKGFIGNKVIAEIDGVVEALNTNEKISDVKVLAVNPSTLTAKFEINGKTVTKTIKSLTDEYNGDVQLVKNLHN